MNRFIELARAVMPVLLPYPIAKFALGLRQSVSVWVQHYAHIGFGGYLVNEEVVITAGHVVDTGKSFGAEEQFAFIG
jgi:hypothetical protein